MALAERNPGAEIAAIVREGDRDRYFAALFAPAAKRGALMALHAYDLALAEVARTTTEPHVGLIRLAWWRDAVSALGDRPVAGQPVLAALSDAGLEPAPLIALAEVYMDRMEGDEAGTCGALLFEIAAGLLGGEPDAVVAAAGHYWSAAGVRRQGGVADTPELSPLRFAATLRPITALAAVSRRDFAGKREPRGSLGRQAAMLRHMLTGRA